MQFGIALNETLGTKGLHQIFVKKFSKSLHESTRGNYDDLKFLCICPQILKH